MNDDNTFRTVDETICQQFESGWAGGNPQPIEALVGEPDSENYLATLEELVHIELEFRWKERDPLKRPQLEDYLKRFEPLADSTILSRLVAQEIQLRLALGETPTSAEYQQRFPEATVTIPATDQAAQDTGVKSEEDVDTHHEMPTMAPESDPDSTPASDPLDSATLAGPEQQAKRQVILEGDFVPGYDLLGELGRGGMGVVYQARDQKLKRIVALKMILSGVHASEQDMQRFQTEAEAVAKLQHPNIVQIFEVGEHKGNPYISLEYQEGGGLDNKIAGTPQNIEESAQLIETLAQAMQVAHQQDIIHRDLKPANILLSADGEPKITDFGLAKRMDEDSNQTKSGAVMGTPSYMAPEQAASSNETIGPAADTYALGAILYHLLTGRPPFRAETQLDTLMQVISDEPLPPRRLNSKVPADLETICLKCLQKDIDRRYVNSEELAEDLRRFQAGEPIAARPVSAIERSWKWARRRPALAGMIGVSIVAAVALVVGGLVYNGKLLDEKNFANSQTQLAKVEADRANEQTKLAEEARIEADAQRGVATDRATEANKARSQAEEQRQKALEAEIQAKHLLAQAHVDKGALALYDGDTTQALAWFATAQAVDQGNAMDNRLSAMRTWNTLNQTPKPIIEMVTRAVAQANQISGVRLAERAILNRDNNQVLVLYNQQSRFSKDWLRLVDLNSRSTEQAQKDSKKLRFSKFHNFTRSVNWSPDHSRIALTYEKTQSALSLFTKKTLYATTVFDAKTGTPIFTLDNKTPVWCQYDPAGKYFLTLDDPGKILLWNAGTGAPASAPKLPEDLGVYKANFSPDGQRLILNLSQTSTVAIWHIAKGEMISVEPDNEFWPITIVCHPEQPLAALGGFNEIRILDIATGSFLNKRLTLAKSLLKKTNHFELKTSFSPDGKFLVAYRGQFVQVWDTNSWTPWIRELRHDAKVNHVVFSPDGGRFATCSEDGRVRIWNIQNGRLANAPLNHEGPVIWADFDRDGRHIFTLSNHNRYLSREATLRSWDLATETPPSRAFRHRRKVTDTDFHPNGNQLLTAGDDGRVIIWDVNSAKAQLTIQLDDQVKRAFFAVNGKTVITQTKNNPEVVQLWDATTGKAVSPPLVQSNDMSQVELSPDGKQLLTAGDGRWVYLWNVTDGTKKQFLVPSLRTKVRNAIPLATFANQGKELIIFSGASFILYNTATRTSVSGLTTFVVGHSYSHFIASKSGRLVALVDETAGHREEEKTQTILVYNLRNNKRLAILQPKAIVTKLVFSPDEKHILAATTDNRVHSWQIESGSSQTPPLQHFGKINDLKFSSDGRFLVTASDISHGGGAVQVWELQTGQPVTPPLSEPYGEIVSAEFSPDATTILARRSANSVEVLLYPIVPSAKTGNEQILSAARVLSLSDNQSTAGTTNNWEQVRANWPALTSPTQRDVAEWHRGEVILAIKREDWKAVVANLGPVTESTDDWETYLLRGWYNVEAGNYDDAARDIQTSIERGMPPGSRWYTATGIALIRDDRKSYREICRVGVERLLSNPHQQYATNDIAHCCIQVPGALTSYEQLLKKTRETVDRKRNPPDWFSLYCHGALLYRANKPEEARTFLKDSILWETRVATRDETGSLGKETIEAILETNPRNLEVIRNWFFLVMCEHQLGNKQQAQQLYQRCQKLNAQREPATTYNLVYDEIDRYLVETATLLGVSSEKKSSAKSENK